MSATDAAAPPAAAHSNAAADVPSALPSPSPLVPHCSLRALLHALDREAAASAADPAASSVAAAAVPSPLSFLRSLPVGHHRGCELSATAIVRAILVLTPRLTFVSLQSCDDDHEAAAQTDSQAAAHSTEASVVTASSAASSSPSSSAAASSAPPSSKLVQLVLKLNDGTGWGAAQQAHVRPLLRVGARIALHAFVEINSLAAAADTAASATASIAASSAESSSASSAALPAAQLWRQVAPKAQTSASAAAPSESSDAASSTAASSSPSAAAASLPPVDPRLTLHAISFALIDETADRSPAALSALRALTVAHSAHFAAAMKADAQASPATADADATSAFLDLSAVRIFPHIGLALRERVELAHAAEQKRLAKIAAAAAAAVSASASSVAASAGSAAASSSADAAAAALPSDPPTDRAALAAYYKALNKSKQQERAKRAPKQNHNRGLKFFDFLLSEFGPSVLSGGGGVLDVAGGQGQLSFELSKRDYPCTIVDPRRVDGTGWDKRRARYLQIRGRIAAELGSRAQPRVSHLQTEFNAAFVSAAETRVAWSAASLIVGLHPDQASDAIVTLSLAERRPFAIVPCCVFPQANPQRRLRSGEHVKTHEQLCQYYCELSPSVQRAQLDFEGRNTVLFSHAKGRPADSPQQQAQGAEATPDADAIAAATEAAAAPAES